MVKANELKCVRVNKAVETKTVNGVSDGGRMQTTEESIESYLQHIGENEVFQILTVDKDVFIIYRKTVRCILG
jgi:hypothetical protein